MGARRRSCCSLAFQCNWAFAEHLRYLTLGCRFGSLYVISYGTIVTTVQHLQSQSAGPEVQLLQQDHNTNALRALSIFFYFLSFYGKRGRQLGSVLTFGN